MAVGVIHSGVCGFTINVKAVSDEDNKVQLEITSNCPNYQKIAKELIEVDAYKEDGERRRYENKLLCEISKIYE